MAVGGGARSTGATRPSAVHPASSIPRHGPSTRDVEWAPPGGTPRTVPACEADAQAVERGTRARVAPGAGRRPAGALLERSAVLRPLGGRLLHAVRRHGVPVRPLRRRAARRRVRRLGLRQLGRLGHSRAASAAGTTEAEAAGGDFGGGMDFGGGDFGGGTEAAATSSPASATLRGDRFDPPRDRSLLRPPRFGGVASGSRSESLCHLCKLLAVSRAWRNIVKAAYPGSSRCPGADVRRLRRRHGRQRDHPRPRRRRRAPLPGEAPDRRVDVHDARLDVAAADAVRHAHRGLLHPVGGHAERASGPRRAQKPEPPRRSTTAGHSAIRQPD